MLAIDEFETIDEKIGEGVFSADLLATIREFDSKSPSVIWTFAGSHPITMLKNAEWRSYLVSVQTIEVTVFTENETRLLLTDPLQHPPSMFGISNAAPESIQVFGGKEALSGYMHKPLDGLTSFSFLPPLRSTMPTSWKATALIGGVGKGGETRNWLGQYSI